MKRISFDPRFVNDTGDDLIPGKIHTIRQNYEYWKHFEGQEVALFTWDGKPYRSKQKVFCVKRIVSVQKTYLRIDDFGNGYCALWFFPDCGDDPIEIEELARNDGFYPAKTFTQWFSKYSPGKMAILHFTNFIYTEDNCESF